MKVGSAESWVTLVLDDGMGWEALVLAASLRSQLTLRKRTALIDDARVSKTMQYLLRTNFDFVETISNAQVIFDGGNTVQNDGMLKKYVWGLPIWRKCVFIGSDSLVLESIDDLFDLDELSAPSTRIGFQETMNLDLFVFKPNRETLKLISASKSKSSDEAIVKNFWKSWNNSSGKTIRNTIFPVLPSELHQHCPRPKIVQFGTAPWIQNSEAGWTWKKYSLKWMEIFSEYILPQLQLNEMNQFYKKSAADLQLPIVPLETAQPAHDAKETLEDGIAVVGMSCRFAGANSVDEYWNLLAEGKCAVRKFPEGRRTFENTGIEKHVAGFLSCAVDEFDAKFFGISPREAPLIDPQQRFLLEVIWESLEDAGLDGTLLKETPTGVFIGVLTQDYDRMLPKNGYIGNEYHHRFLGNAISAIAGRISHFMGFTGPNIAFESSCSSSLAALHFACQSLRNGESNLAIAGGVNLILLPRANASTPDDNTEQIPAAEGVATIVLKQYADAVRDGDDIRAIIRGSALGSDGGAHSAGVPTVSEQVRVCQEALCNAKVNPSEIGYVEGHIMQSNAPEMTAINQVYSAPLFGCVKSNIGNAESAAGIASIIKLILSLQKETIPQNIFSREINQGLTLEEAPSTLTQWEGSQRFGAATAYSATGTLAHAILQSAPIRKHRPTKNPSSARPELVLISAKTPEALRAQYKNYSAFFTANPNLDLSDIAFATNLGRTHFQHRLAIVARDTEDLLQKLEQNDFIGGKMPSNSKSPPIGFLFTGQASQYFGMAKGLYALFEPFRNTIDYCSQVYSRLSGVSLQSVLWEDDTLLLETEYAQPAIFCVQVALVSLWRHFGIRPSVVLGHSVGEYCAAVAAEVISIEDGLKLVFGRSQLVQKLRPGRMLAVKGTLAEATDLLAELNLDEALDIAAVNSAAQVVLSGSPEHIDAFEQGCTSRGRKTHKLASVHAFHSKHVEEILEEFGLIAAGINYRPPTCTYVSSTLGRKMAFEDFRTEYWQCHLRDTVQFSRAVSLTTKLSQTLIEIGPQPVLLGLAMANSDAAQELICCPSLRKTEENWFTFYSAMAKLHVTGVPIVWTNHFGRRFKNLKLPLYPFQRQKYWFVLKDYTDEEDDKERDGIYLNAKRVHPILGYEIPTPNRLLFSQSKLSKELPYLKDCTLGNAPFLSPGGVLELFLAGANQLPGADASPRPLFLQNIEFADYVRLDAGTSIQTVIDLPENAATGITATLYDNRGDSEWNLSAKAEILHGKAPESLELNFDWLGVDASDFMGSEFLKSKSESLPLLELYAANAGDVEVQFGENYRRVARAWRLGNGAILTQLSTAIQDPRVVGHKLSQYICFPSILDAMIQSAFLLDADLSKLCLLKRIRSFTWFGMEAISDEILVYAESGKIHLLTFSGTVLATLDGLEFMAEFCSTAGISKYVEKVAVNMDLDTSHIQMPLDTEDKRLQILAEIISRPRHAEEDVLERHLDLPGKVELEEKAENEPLEMTLEKLLRSTLRLPADEAIDLDQNFTEIGVDSLMGLEIGGKIQELIPGKVISATIVQEYPTMRTLLANLNQI